MSAITEFWTKNGVKHHMLPSNVSDFSSSATYAVGQWVWHEDVVTAANTGLYVCKVEVAVAGPWTGTANWTQISGVGLLFSDSNTALVNVCRQYGGTQIKKDEYGNFYYEVEV